jgi:preprotein translocase subunit SecA
MFQALMDSIWEEFARMIFHVDVEIQPAEVEDAFGPEEEPQDVQLSGGTDAEQPSALAEARAAAGGAAATATAAAPAVAASAGNGDGNGSAGTNAATVVKADAEKIGRNDPCWCGSGKKYKKCHGA